MRKCNSLDGWGGLLHKELNGEKCDARNDAQRFEAGKQLINLQDKSKGVYFMKVIVGKQQQTLRVIIE